MKTFYLTLFISGLFLTDCFAQQETDEEKQKDILEMSFEELMSVEVTTASNKSEKLQKAPATILVVTEQDIRERGYRELYDILNDLPGFDLEDR
jgi:outer membrane receptor for ferrienterochelin and colicins